MESLGFIVVALSILGFGMISGRVQRSVLTPPMVFVVVGFLVSQRVLGLVEFNLESRLIDMLAELTLVLVLFTDAARIDLRCLRREHNLPIRLLVVGLPLTILFGTLTAAVLFDKLSFWEGAILGVILAPTDAALGQAVVSSPKVPVRIRQTLNVESGLNDGIVLPILLILLSVAEMVGHKETLGFWIQFVALQIILGPLVGIGVGYVGGKLVELGLKTCQHKPGVEEHMPVTEMPVRLPQLGQGFQLPKFP
jgi:NhaP-type Na+/H+ or K+/H+ antiporter